MIRILLADDHTLVRQGLRRILEEQPDWQVVAETGDGREAVRLAVDLQPDVVDSRHRHAAAERASRPRGRSRSGCRRPAS